MHGRCFTLLAPIHVVFPVSPLQLPSANWVSCSSTECWQELVGVCGKQHSCRGSLPQTAPFRHQVQGSGLQLYILLFNHKLEGFHEPYFRCDHLSEQLTELRKIPGFLQRVKLKNSQGEKMHRARYGGAQDFHALPRPQLSSIWICLSTQKLSEHHCLRALMEVLLCRRDG